MPTIIKLSNLVLPAIAGKPYKNITDFQIPKFPVGIPVGSYVFSGSEADSLVNLNNPNLPLIKTGSPVFGLNGVTVNGGNYLNTQLPQKAAYTCLFLGEVKKSASAADRQLAFTNYMAGTGNVGQSFGFTNTNLLAAYEESTAGAVLTRSQDISSLSTAQMAVFGCRVRADGRVKLFALQGGTPLATTEGGTVSRNPVDARPMLIGAGYAASSYPGNLTIKALSVFHNEDAELSDEEILENMAYLEGVL